MSENAGRNYKKTYDRMRDNLKDKGDDKSQEQAPADNESKGDDYVRRGNVRNICFEWLDKRRLFLNYAYLVSCELNVTNDRNILMLGFTSHTMQIEGVSLDGLYEKLIMHLPFVIREHDERYANEQTDDEPIVTKIEVLTIDTQKGSAEAEPLS